MKRKTFILIVFALALTATGQDDPNCVPEEFEPPDWSDPNMVIGLILPAFVDANGVIDYNAPAGKFGRSGPYCDPDGDPVTIEVHTPGWSVSKDSAALTWKLAGDVQPGPQYVHVSIEDITLYDDSILVDFTVLIWGIAPENRPPVLY